MLRETLRGKNSFSITRDRSTCRYSARAGVLLQEGHYQVRTEESEHWLHTVQLIMNTTSTYLGPVRKNPIEFLLRNWIKLNSMVWVLERTIPTDRPPLVGEVIANFCGYRLPRGQRDASLRPYSPVSRQEPLLFYQVAPQLYSRGWVDLVPDPLLFFSGSAGNRTRASGSVAKNSDH
jgi:hypothetical protein